MSENTEQPRSPLSAKDLDYFRRKLLAARARLVSDITDMSEETLHSYEAGELSKLPLHLADASSDNEMQERMHGLLESERDMVEEINAALERIEEGTYGVCEATGKPIPKQRLEFIPWTRYTIEAEREREKQERRRSGRGG